MNSACAGGTGLDGSGSLLVALFGTRGGAVGSDED